MRAARLLLLLLSASCAVSCAPSKPSTQQDASPLPLDGSADTERTDTTPPRDGSQADQAPPSGWSCSTNIFGERVCVLPGRVPQSGFTCHLDNDRRWRCSSLATTPPSESAGWSCAPRQLGTTNTWTCFKAHRPGEDTPNTTAHWACAKASSWGTRCTEVSAPPGFPEVPGGERCTPGRKRWCDPSDTGSAWGQTTCKPDGTWPTIPYGSSVIFDCPTVLPARPATLCACYHSFFNPLCCERPDCVVPEQPSAASCPVAQRKLCDACTPWSSSCEGLCVTTISGETFCGPSCGTSAPCPSGHLCLTVESLDGSGDVCVPEDLSCYL